jgi:cytochrome c-type biogenesis protein CcmH
MMRSQGYPAIWVMLVTVVLQAGTNPTEVSEQAYVLAKELRCVVCQNQSVAESDAGIAQDMRSFIAMELEKGKSKQDIIDQLVDAYGEFIVFTPTMTDKNLPLWLLPVLIVIGVVVRIKKNTRKT